MLTVYIGCKELSVIKNEVMTILYEHKSIQLIFQSFFPEIDEKNCDFFIGWSARNKLALSPQFCILTQPEIPYLHLPCSTEEIRKFIRRVPTELSGDKFISSSFPYWQLAESMRLLENNQQSFTRLQMLDAFCNHEWPGWYDDLFTKLYKVINNNKKDISFITRIVIKNDGKFAAQVDFVRSFSTLFHSAKNDAVNRWFGPLRTMLCGYAPDEPGGYRLSDILLLLDKGEKWWVTLPSMLNTTCDYLVKRGISDKLPFEYKLAKIMAAQATDLSNTIVRWLAVMDEKTFLKQHVKSLKQIDRMIDGIQRIEHNAAKLRKRLVD